MEESTCYGPRIGGGCSRFPERTWDFSWVLMPACVPIRYVRWKPVTTRWTRRPRAIRVTLYESSVTNDGRVVAIRPLGSHRTAASRGRAIRRTR
jgi:hypothetical protein